MTTKTTLVDYMAAKFGMPKAEAHREISNVWAAMEDVLREGEELRASFGTFKVKDIPEKEAVYMIGSKKGEAYVIPAHKRLAFKASVGVREALKA